MEPNFVDGDMLMVDKISYQVGNPERGDVVAMFFPGEASKRFIKRVVGLPGEKVRVASNKLYINGKLMAERYLPKGTVTVPNLERQLTLDEYFVDGDMLMVDKISYQVGNPERGDVVAMFFPGEASKRFIKRVVGLPGEKVRVASNKLYINGKLMAERYLPKGTVTVPNLERQLTLDEYFVVGDNRTNSSDSRAWGPVPESYIVGKASKKLFNVGASN